MHSGKGYPERVVYSTGGYAPLIPLPHKLPIVEVTIGSFFNYLKVACSFPLLPAICNPQESPIDLTILASFY